VRAAAATSVVPLGGDALVASFHPAGRSDIPGTRPTVASVGPRYFETLGIPLAGGRDFLDTDRAGTPVVTIVNQTFANTYFPGRNPLGEQVLIGGEPPAEIVGVVADSKVDTIGEPPKSVLYYPFAQRSRRLTVVIRTEGPPAAALSAIRRAMSEVDPTLAVGVSTLREAASIELAMRQTGTVLVGAVGVVGLLLTAIGLYGVVAYLVASRTIEMGIRMALGASPRGLRWVVMRGAAGLVVFGVAAGTAAALIVTPALATFLAGLSPLDPIAYAGGATVLILVGLAASYLPARRVTRVDPMIALRR
jgi:predicted permease